MFGVLDHCKTPMGSRRLSSWLNSPLRDQKAAQERADTIEALLEKTYLFDDYQNVLKIIPDFERIATRIALGTVRPKDLASLRDALPSLEKLSDIAKGIDTALSRTLGADMPLNSELHALLQKLLWNILRPS